MMNNKKIQEGLGDGLITTKEAAEWLMRMAVADGVLSPKEENVLGEFANSYGLPAGPLVERAKQMNISGRPEVSLVEYCSKDGRDFEDHVVAFLNTVNEFVLLDWTGDKYHEGIFDLRNLNPDLHLRWHKDSGAELDFWIECKWRHYWLKNDTDFYFEIDKEQLRRYRMMAKKLKQKVFVALAIGHTGKEPEHIHLIPIGAFANSRITLHAARKYRIDDSPQAFAEAVKRHFRHSGISPQQ